MRLVSPTRGPENRRHLPASMFHCKSGMVACRSRRSLCTGQDYESSPVHRLLRERRAAHAGLQWDIEAGKVPPILELRVGETNLFLGGRVLEDVVVHWEGLRELADVRLLRSGFEAVGRQAGSAPLTVRTSQGLEAYVLRA